MEKVARFITKLFPLWVILCALFAFFVPGPFLTWGKSIPYLLGVVMLGMGLTMSVTDFKLVLSQPKDVLYGVILRFIIMPGVAFVVAKVLNLPPYLAAGLILVGCCPSGTASNVMTFLSKGDTALSVTVSSVNTVIAPFVTPYLFLLLAGSFIEVDAVALLLDILKIVLVPVAVGITLRALFTRFIQRIMPLIPLVSVVAIILIITIVVALSAGRLASVALIAFIAVALHNGLGLALGYWSARGVKLSHKKSKAIAFEIGMENSGLAVALAMAHLDPIAAVPGAIFSVWHNLTGSLLAGYWNNRDKDEASDDNSKEESAS